MTAMITEMRQIEAPFDSGDFPKNVLIQGDDLDSTYCDRCLRPAVNWPYASSPGVPGALFNAALYCSDCMPLSYNEWTGERVSTVTGAPK